MFENIIGQAQVVGRLTQEIAAGLLPPVLLLFGPDYSGKCSTALELARVLTCAGEDDSVPWGCGCRACEMQRHLTHPDTLMLGGRYFLREIAVAAAALKRDTRPSLRYLMERSVRKLAHRFDQALWEEDDAKIGKAAPLLESLDEQLEPFLPGGTLPGKDEFSDCLDRMVDTCEKLASVTNLDAVPVGTVRRLSAWSRTVAQGGHKIAIMEHVDRLQESARNALLKTLEEPPHGVTFVLTATHRGAVIETILSRARSYGFHTRGADESREVISRVFQDKSHENASIRDYLVSIDGRGLRPLAERYIEACLGGGELELGLLDEIDRTLEAFGAAEGFRYLMEELTDLLRSVLLAGDVLPTRTVSRWNGLLATTAERVEAYHVQPKLALEGLYYALRQAA